MYIRYAKENLLCTFQIKYAYLFRCFAWKVTKKKEVEEKEKMTRVWVIDLAVLCDGDGYCKVSRQ